jgi:hypothetical protein
MLPDNVLMLKHEIKTSTYFSQIENRSNYKEYPDARPKYKE